MMGGNRIYRQNLPFGVSLLAAPTRGMTKATCSKIGGQWVPKGTVRSECVNAGAAFEADTANNGNWDTAKSRAWTSGFRTRALVMGGEYAVTTATATATVCTYLPLPPVIPSKLAALRLPFLLSKLPLLDGLTASPSSSTPCQLSRPLILF